MRPAPQLPESMSIYEFPVWPEASMKDEEDFEGGHTVYAFLVDVWHEAAKRCRGERACIDDVAAQVATQHVKALDPERLALIAFENPGLVNDISRQPATYGDLEQKLRVHLEDLAYFTTCDFLEDWAEKLERAAVGSR